ncbi:MAG: DNA double-strand break repair nuclease NurA [Candidatus Methanoperedens sp.]|nr:DNA double-strand break repair nuclease NurA [Candidatus Methanoperedens sp.]MCE8424235.1 DNA double-strand break repair nuclease NurA [Candidatus Methanoperedens sp.]MCE8427694.1 DNA double-strand break repair nuclease NurA [Candidatus Methanoperedens sp.]
MLDVNNISLQFDEKLSAIRFYDVERSESTREYRAELEKLKMIIPELNKNLPFYSGAKILEPGKLVHQFPYNWQNRNEAMEWVDSVLSGVAVGAVDGSQIYSKKNYEIPIAVIQTSAIYNKHTSDRDYSQETGAMIITPDEFDNASVYSFGSEYVDARRFSMECDQIIHLLKKHKKQFILLDGALILSHINILNRNIKEIYIEGIGRLLEASENTRNPVIGFIDTTMPGDITLMMHHMFGLRKSKLSDTHLFSHLLWGERTAAFLCDRDDRRGDDARSVLDNYGRFRNEIGFFYMRTGRGLPSRVEFPAWVYQEGLIDKIADIIRAECVIRGNYPDILMRAHDAAVIRMGEHAIFYTMLENFCNVNGIQIHRSAKDFHKTFEQVIRW